MIIGITGKIGSGKSTTAEILVKYGYTEYSMASPLKEIGKIFGFTDEQLYGTQEQKLQIHPHWGISARTFLQKAGTEIFREAMPKIIPDMKIERTIWADLFKLKYQKEPNTYVISDIRFPDEADVIKELGGIIIRTVRDNNVSSSSKAEHVHRSELEMDQIVADYVIDNNSLSKEELSVELQRIIRSTTKVITNGTLWRRMAHCGCNRRFIEHDSEDEGCDRCREDLDGTIEVVYEWCDTHRPIAAALELQQRELERRIQTMMRELDEVNRKLITLKACPSI